jgi:Plant transposon protein
MKTEERLSEWIESFRKDAECVFGILKGRFRVLKTGIRLDGPQSGC